MLKGKKVLLGVTASIAAYKTAELVRLFKKAGASVRVIQTEASLDFVASLTLATLSDNPVLIKMVDPNSGEWSNHVELGLWADLMIIAPATANTISKMVNGTCDNLLIATYLSAKCPVWFAPAMDLDMYKHPSTVNNLKTLVGYGNICIEATEGELASGLVGKGRMEEPEKITSLIQAFFNRSNEFKGKKVLVTAGPTYESIDPVRFLSNNSSGKMGIAIADEFADKGAEVTLVCGPSKVYSKNNSVKRIDVKSAHQMFIACKNAQRSLDVVVMAAAVADYTPSSFSEKKVKKSDGDLKIELKRTVDILKYLGDNKLKHQILIGFAMETDNEIKNAGLKAKNKNADFIVLNSLNEIGAGFQGDTNKVTFVYNNQTSESFKLKSKLDVAKDIVNKVNELILKNA